MNDNTTETTTDKSPFALAGMGRQYPAQFLWGMQETCFSALRDYLDKSPDPHAAQINQAIDYLVTISVAAEQKHLTGTLNDSQADLVATSIPDLVEVLATLGYEW